MGLFSYRFPHEFDARDYVKLIPGKPRYIVLNLTAIGDSSNTEHFSIQAVSTANVSVSCYVSNFSRCPWTNKTEHKSWEVPTPLSGTPSGLWIPCTSISTFSVSPGINFNQTGDWKDPYQFLMFAITASEPSPSSSSPDTPIDDTDDQYITEREMIDPETGLRILKVKKDLTPPKLESDIYHNEALSVEEAATDPHTYVAFSLAICFL